MKQTNDSTCLRVNPRNIRALVSVAVHTAAVHTARGQVVGLTAPAVLTRDHMVNLERGQDERQLASGSIHTVNLPGPEPGEQSPAAPTLLFNSPKGLAGLGLHHRQQITHMQIAIQLRFG